MHLALAVEGEFASGDGKGWSLETLGHTVAEAEKAGFAFVLLPDDLEGAGTWPEATMLIAWLAARTRSIGLLSRASTIRHEPYNLARRFASLDMISHGRAGWLATLGAGKGDMENYSGSRRVGDADVAERAGEFVKIVKGLWESWDADALVLDRGNARFFDPGKMHLLDHSGEHFSVRGPLNVVRSPQGAPILAVEVTDDASAAIARQFADIVILDESGKGGVGDGPAAFVRIEGVTGERLKSAADGAAGALLVASSPADARSLFDGAAAELAGDAQLGATLRETLELSTKGAGR